MDTETVLAVAPAPLNPFDPDLPLLASQAAIELQCLLRGDPKPSLRAVQRLGDRLEASFRRPENGTVQIRAADPSTVCLVHTALNEVKWAGPVKTLDELFSHATKLAEGLRTSEPSSEPQGLVRIRDFCAALARCATAFRRSPYFGRPGNPYRR
jgi:hypothetical protein